MALGAERRRRRASSPRRARCWSPARTCRSRGPRAACRRAIAAGARSRHARRARHRLPAGAVGPDRARPRRAALRRLATAVSAQLQSVAAAVRPGRRHRGRDPHRRRLRPTRCAALRRLRALTAALLVVKRGADGLRRLRRRDSRRHRAGRRRARASRSRCSTCSAPATPSWPASCAAGCATSRSRDCCALRQRLRRARRLAPRLRAGDAELGPSSSTSSRARTRRCARCATTPPRTPAPRTTRPATWPELAGARLRPSRAARGARRRGTAGATHPRVQAPGRRRRAARRERARAGAPASIVDDRYGEDVLLALTGSGSWVARPVELPGSRPLAFEAGDERRRWRCAPGRPSTSPSAWSATTRRRHELRAAQLARLHAAGGLHRHRPRAAGRGDPAARAAARRHLARAQADLRRRHPARLVEAAAAAARAAMGCHRRARSRATTRTAAACCCSAWRRARRRSSASFALAARARRCCKGFAVGRSIFCDAARRWFAGGCERRRRGRRRRRRTTPAHRAGASVRRGPQPCRGDRMMHRESASSASA